MNPIQTSRPGFALVLTVLISLAVGALVVAASTIGTNVSLVGDYYSRQDRLAAAADEGIELARARLNGDKDLFPESLYVAIERDQPVLDGSGKPIPGVTRSTYVGPVGITSGQYGVYAMVVSVARDAGGATVIRRSQLMQESFSRFAYFTNFEGDIYFGGGDQIHGPLHTNDNIKIHSNGGAIFHGPVSTAKTISGKQYGQFKQGYRENAGVIPLPEVAELSKLRAQLAELGHLRQRDHARILPVPLLELAVLLARDGLRGRDRAVEDRAAVRVDLDVVVGVERAMDLVPAAEVDIPLEVGEVGEAGEALLHELAAADHGRAARITRHGDDHGVDAVLPARDPDGADVGRARDPRDRLPGPVEHGLIPLDRHVQ